MTTLSKDLDAKLRALLTERAGADGWTYGMLWLVRDAAQAGADDALERAAQLLEDDCDCQSYANDFRDLKSTAPTGPKMGGEPCIGCGATDGDHSPLLPCGEKGGDS